MSSRSPTPAEPAPAAPDFGILLALAFRVYVDELHEELAARGYDDIRPSFGVVFRALAERPLTLTQLAAQLNVSKQAIAKVVGELRSRRLVAQRATAADRRAKRLELTERGRAVVRAATEIGARVEDRLRAELGADTVAAMRKALEHLVISSGAETEMRARRARPVW